MEQTKRSFWRHDDERFLPRAVVAVLHTLTTERRKLFLVHHCSGTKRFDPFGTRLRDARSRFDYPSFKRSLVRFANNRRNTVCETAEYTRGVNSRPKSRRRMFSGQTQNAVVRLDVITIVRSENVRFGLVRNRRFFSVPFSRPTSRRSRWYTRN